MKVQINKRYKVKLSTDFIDSVEVKTIKGGYAYVTTKDGSGYWVDLNNFIEEIYES